MDNVAAWTIHNNSLWAFSSSKQPFYPPPDIHHHHSHSDIDDDEDSDNIIPDDLIDDESDEEDDIEQDDKTPSLYPNADAQQRPHQMTVSIIPPAAHTALPPFSSIAAPADRPWSSGLPSPHTKSMNPQARQSTRFHHANSSHSDLSSALESFTFASSQKHQLSSTNHRPQQQQHPHRFHHHHRSAVRRVKTPESHRAQHRIAEFVAQNTSSMICYLWFGNIGASSQQIASSSPSSKTSPPSRQSLSASTDYETARLQFVPSPAFIDFLHKLLTTTQVSQSVIVLSLHYIYRLKSANRHIRGKAGSELRLAVTALMLANKFLDDNTYTNKTWSDISRISLAEINQMEREFLHGVDNRLYVDVATYESWLQLLNGLIIAKEKEYDLFRRRTEPTIPNHLNYSPTSHSGHRLRPPSPHHAGQRARSSSPMRTPFQFTFTLPPLSQPGPVKSEPPQRAPHPHHFPMSRHQHPASHPPVEPVAQPMSRPGAKRSVFEAFSPQSASQSVHPSKRPLSLDLDLIRLEPSHGYDRPIDSAPPDTGSTEDSIMQCDEGSHHTEPPSSFSNMDVTMHSASESAALHASSGQDQYHGGSSHSSSRGSVSSASSGGSSSGVLPSTNHPSTQLGATNTLGQATLRVPPHPVHPRTLAAPLSVDERWLRTAIPQYLTFNTLSASPLGDEQHENGARKTVLRFHQPAPYQHRAPTSNYGYSNQALGIQSARTSPRDTHIGIPMSSTPSAPFAPLKHHEKSSLPLPPSYPASLAAAQHHPRTSHSSNIQHSYHHSHIPSDPLSHANATLPHNSINISPPHINSFNSSSAPSSNIGHRQHQASIPGLQELDRRQTPHRHSPLAKFANAGPPGYQWKAISHFGQQNDGLRPHRPLIGGDVEGAFPTYSPASTVGGSGSSPIGTAYTYHAHAQHQFSQSHSNLPTYTTHPAIGLPTPPHPPRQYGPPLQPISQPSAYSHQGWADTTSPVSRGRRM